jgi:hypothetical protein
MAAKFLAIMVLGVFASSHALAATFDCPAPALIKCVPAVTNIGGWRANGGQMTGNAFESNSQCGNVDKLSPTKQRLLCCYEKCGVFYRDVTAKTCTKVSESQFNCE